MLEGSLIITMLEGSLIIEGAAWRVRALRLMELDIDRFSTVLRGLRAARDVLGSRLLLNQCLKPRATCTSNSRSAGPDPELSLRSCLRYGPRPERSTGVDGGIVQSDRLFRHTRR